MYFHDGRKMSYHVSQILLLRRELTSSAETFCCLVELNVGILERDAIKIHRMIAATQDLMGDLVIFPCLLD